MALTNLVGPLLDNALPGITSALALIQPQGRSIGSIFPDVVIEEAHQDESVVTQDPVEGGAIVTDHIIDRPPVVVIRGGFSNSSAGYVGYVQEQYQELLALKAAKRPFFLSTGKRSYRNMVITALSVMTDPHSENTLMFVCVCQFLNIVQTQSAQLSASTASPAASQSDQANPAATAGTSNLGTIEPRSISDTSFAGAFNPGAFSTTPSVADQNSGSSLGATLGQTGGGAFSGLSPPPLVSGDVGELVATDPSGSVVSTVPAYNPFATGAFGGT